MPGPAGSLTLLLTGRRHGQVPMRFAPVQARPPPSHDAVTSFKLNTAKVGTRTRANPEHCGCHHKQACLSTCGRPPAHESVDADAMQARVLPWTGMCLAVSVCKSARKTKVMPP